MSALLLAPPAAPLTPSSRAPAIGLRPLLRRLAASLAVACVAPGLILYALLETAGVVPALLSALVWSYGATAWRWATGRPVSGLLLVTVVVLSMRTLFALATGSTSVYFVEPIVTDAVVATILLLSLATRRPLAARLADDFYPLDVELARTPSVRRLLHRLTLLWAATGLLKAGVGLWLLVSLPAADFVLAKTAAVVLITVAAVTVTVRASLSVLDAAGSRF